MRRSLIFARHWGSRLLKESGPHETFVDQIAASSRSRRKSVAHSLRREDYFAAVVAKVKLEIPDPKYRPRLFGRNRSMLSGTSNSLIVPNGRTFVVVALAAASSINGFRAVGAALRLKAKSRIANPK
jgi:hypothetical protein